MHITHVNHASLWLTNGVGNIVTDPWIDADAFLGWTQHPRPFPDIISRLRDLPANERLVLISHGHDDHMDDKAINKYFAGSTILIPKYKSPGLLLRTKRLATANVIEVDETGFEWRNFKFRAYVNPEYTGDDAIITIASADKFVVHANDNWHVQPNFILDAIKADARSYDQKRVAWLAQVGIAGSFPIFYPQYDVTEKTLIVQSHLKRMLDAGIINAMATGAGWFYAYANQSKFLNSSNFDYRRDEWIQELMEAVRPKVPLKIGQLFPGNKIFNINFPMKSFPLTKDVTGLELSFNENLKSRIESLASECNDYLRTRLRDSKFGKYVSFISGDIDTIPKELDADLVIVSKPEVWEKVLTKEANLECMTIGGMGLLYKGEKDESVREIHIQMTNFAYKFQNRKT